MPSAGVEELATKGTEVTKTFPGFDLCAVGDHPFPYVHFVHLVANFFLLCSLCFLGPSEIWPQKAQKSQNEFLELDSWGTEIDQESMPISGGSQVTENLRRMLTR